MTIKEVAGIIEEYAPLSYQEDYDNSGLQTGNPNSEIQGVLLSTDVTEAVIDEAIANKCNMIISHHPVIFNGLKKLIGSNYVERVIEKAIKNDIALYAAHTNIDNIKGGVSTLMAEKLGLENISILSPRKDNLFKLVCYVPHPHAKAVRDAMFDAGAGHIGDYDMCSFNISGEGSYRAGINSKPYAGEIGKIHFEDETKIETVVLAPYLNKCIKQMIKSHPYEEVAYDIFQLHINDKNTGMGALGILNKEMSAETFLEKLKNTFSCQQISYRGSLSKTIRKVAMCGGSGSFLISKAMNIGADIFITSDIKYHDYFITPSQMLLADIGHYESEQFTKEIFYDLLTKKKPKFAVRFSDINTNPIKHF